MPRRRAWNGDPPKGADDARRRLLSVARECVERLGFGKAGLADVAVAAGVTRQTVYRYFEDADDLFHSAAALGSGGFYERLHVRAEKRRSLATRLAECLVFAIVEIPRDPHLAYLVSRAPTFSVRAALELGFVQEEIVALAGGPDRVALGRVEIDRLAELLVRLLHSFLADPGLDRDEEALRAYFVPLLEKVVGDVPSPRRAAPSPRDREG